MLPSAQKKHPEWVYKFNYRGPRIVREIEETKGEFDIICLQEVDNFKELYKAEFERLGYDTRVSYKKCTDKGKVIDDAPQ